MNEIRNDQRILEFNQIKDKLSGYASTGYAKKKITQLTPFLNELQLKRAQNETSDARAIIDNIGNPQIPDVTSVGRLMEIIEKEGLLYPRQLEAVRQFAVSCRRLKGYLKKAEKTGKSIAFCGEMIDSLDEIDKQINRCICAEEIDSAASKELLEIRRRIDSVNAKRKEKLEGLLKANKKYMSDSFVAVKNGQDTLPVKREYKNQIPGKVIATSATGTTVFLEPSAVAKITEQRNLLKAEEEMEKERILYSLAALIHGYQSEIKKNIETMEALDFAFAKGKLSAEMDAVAPAVNTERRIRIQKGRHPLLNRDTCIPIDFEIGEQFRGIVITGPNTGGKTVSLKLVGLFSLMAQCGLHLPCQSADICMNGNVLCDIGDGQNISESLSTFSAHITNIVEILGQTGRESLVLLDELGSGTDPAEGMGIAVAILEELRKRQCLFVATTHYPEVKSYAKQADGLINARMTFDEQTLKPQYRLVIGQAGESCAFSIAKRLGFPKHLLEYAHRQTYQTGKERCTGEYQFDEMDNTPNSVTKSSIQKQQKKKELPQHALQFQIGDSVVVHPEKKIGIVYQTVDDKGMLGVQVQGKKQMVVHKRLELKTPASELYPPDYDFSILFDTVENRKARHKMNRKHCPDTVITYEDGEK